MSETKLATKADLKEMYDRMLPYLGGSADAGFTPVGTIISVMGNHAPANYLICDGTVYNIADYPELANYFLQEFGSKNYFGGDGTTTFAVPSLQGEFLRGAGTNTHANQGNGAAVGVHQDASTIPQVGDNGTNLIISKNKWTEHADSSIRDRTDNVCRYVGTQEGTTVTQSYMLRPTNTSVLYCIATKNFYIDPTLDYSTDEKIVGTWIDGKPIYQKTFTGTVDAYSSITNKAIGASVDKVVDVRGIIGNSVSLIGMTNDAMNTGIAFVVLDNSDVSNPNTFICYCKPNGQSAFVGRSYYVTIQYTKTTL